MEKITMFGNLLNSVQKTRKMTEERAITDLWKRNKLNPNASGYKLNKLSRINRNGAEVSEYQLYKLVDTAVTTLTSKVLVETNGVEGVIKHD